MNPERGEELLKILKAALADLENAGGKKDLSDYRAYLHGQVYGLATALKMIYPGPGNLGEKAALALRQVITEHSCRCGGDDDSPEGL
ncbi:MAG: hypothetical protein K6T66_00860 [Peptococcaceae bacterium]|nr:hypothetical protein [Peptococcaceae bacterium]